MSTKRLSHTVIEGGRANSNKYERYQSHAEERAASRDFCKHALLDPEFAEENMEVAIKPVSKGFTDKLSPMYRWLDAQVGRPWSEVRAEVFQKFDTRTTAGRHITFDHLLKEVVDSDSGFDKYGRIVDPAIPKESSAGRTSYWSFADYYVDQQGILRGKADRNKRRWYNKLENIAEADYKAVSSWLNGRMVIDKGGKLHWLSPMQGIWLASWMDPNNYPPPIDYWYRNPLAYYLLTNGSHEETHYIPSVWDPSRPIKIISKIHSDYWQEVSNPFSFRRRGELTEAEVKVFKSFKRKLREDILAYGQGR